MGAFSLITTEDTPGRRAVNALRGHMPSGLKGGLRRRGRARNHAGGEALPSTPVRPGLLSQIERGKVAEPLTAATAALATESAHAPALS